MCIQSSTCNVSSPNNSSLGLCSMNDSHFTLFPTKYCNKEFKRNMSVNFVYVSFIQVASLKQVPFLVMCKYFEEGKKKKKRA